MHVMDIARSIVALFLGLVIQFSQVPTRAADQPANPCATQSIAMACCAGLEACPCVDDSAPGEKPAPAIPAGVNLKYSLATSSEDGNMEATPSSLLASISVLESQTDIRSGYQGVPLNVAFCSFVI